MIVMTTPVPNRTIPLIIDFIQRHAVCVLPIQTSPAALSYRPCSGHRAINSHRVLYAQSDATRAGMNRSGMTRSGMTRSGMIGYDYCPTWHCRYLTGKDETFHFLAQQLLHLCWLSSCNNFAGWAAVTPFLAEQLLHLSWQSSCYAFLG